MALVGLHAIRRSVNDEDSLRARLLQHAVHPRRHLRHAARGVLAVVTVPHVADDDGGAGRVPRLGGADDAVLTAARRRLDALLERQLERFGGGQIRACRSQRRAEDELQQDGNRFHGVTIAQKPADWEPHFRSAARAWSTLSRSSRRRRSSANARPPDR